MIALLCRSVPKASPKLRLAGISVLVSLIPIMPMKSVASASRVHVTGESVAINIGKTEFPWRATPHSMRDNGDIVRLSIFPRATCTPNSNRGVGPRTDIIQRAACTHIENFQYAQCPAMAQKHSAQGSANTDPRASGPRRNGRCSLLLLSPP